MSKPRDKIVKEFRNFFKRTFYIDVTGIVLVLALFISSVIMFPIIDVLFEINAYYYMIIMQTANLIFCMWVWKEVKRINKELQG